MMSSSARLPGSSRPIVMMDWQSTAEGETVLQHFYNPQTTGRKLFGILERPSILTQVEEVCYKLFFTGKAGIGKTASIARLAGTTMPSSYIETVGIRKTNIYWPVKIWDKVILFKLQCWDAGENTIKKYSHIMPDPASENPSEAGRSALTTIPLNNYTRSRRYFRSENGRLVILKSNTMASSPTRMERPESPTPSTSQSAPTKPSKLNIAYSSRASSPLEGLNSPPTGLTPPPLASLPPPQPDRLHSARVPRP